MSFDQLYSEFINVWGYEPSPLAKRVARELPEAAKVLEIGAGEGRDAIFFASFGHRVRAVEASQAAAEVIRKRISGRNDLGVEVVFDDVVEMRLRQNEYDLVFANMSLQFMTRGQRLELLDRIRSSARKDGLIAITQPTVEEAAWKKLQHNREYVHGLCTLRFRGEVMNFAQVGEYRQEFAKDKIIEYWEGTVEDQGHPGYEKPHTHSIVSVIARIIARPGQDTEKTS